MTVKALLTLAFLATSACAVRHNPVSDDAVAIANVRAARARWNDAVSRRDTSTLSGLVVDSVSQASQQFARVGSDAYLSLFSRIVTRRPDVQWRYLPETVSASADEAFETGTWIERWSEKHDTIELTGGYSAVWRRDDGRWKIAAEIFSVTACEGGSYCKQ